MRRRKNGTWKGGSGARVTSRRQAHHDGLSEARGKGAQVPRNASSIRSITRTRGFRGLGRQGV